MSEIPDDLKYSQNHTWVEPQSDGTMRVGITDFAQQELGDIVFVELPEKGRSYSEGEECALVESVKSASDVYCPLSGEIVEVNGDVEESPEKINIDPYGDGWIFCIKPGDDSGYDDLIDADDYRDMLDEN